MSTQPTWAEGVAKLYKEVVNGLEFVTLNLVQGP